MSRCHRLARWVLVAALAAGLVGGVSAQSGAPVLIGLDLEVADLSSTSDEAIQLGVRHAVDEINARGGVLKGRPLHVVVKDNRSIPTRGVDNLRQFAAMPDLVAVMTGKFSPVALEQTKRLPELGMILLDPWAAADGIIQNDQRPNWAFRLSMSDSMAVEAVLAHARQRKLRSLGVLLPNIAWGRSVQAALEKRIGASGLRLAGIEWYNWGGDTTLVERALSLQRQGAEALFLVANEREGAQLVQGFALLPEARRLPVISHWGVAGGDFPRLAGPALATLDFVVVQTFSFEPPRHPAARRLAEAAMSAFQVTHPEAIPSAVGIAHAYDLTHLLALAVDRAGSTDRAAIRAALERLPAFEGVVKRHAPAFTPTRHEALSAADLFFARFQADGRLSRLAAPGRPR